MTEQDTAPQDEFQDIHHGPGWAEQISSPSRHGWMRKLSEKSELVETLRQDVRANEGPLRPGFQALAFQRLGHWARSDAQAPSVLKKSAAVASKAGYLFCRNVYGIDLPDTVEVGRRVRIVEQHGIVIHPFATIGDDCIIRQGATLGAISGDPARYRFEAPRLGSNVSVGANACVLGDITIGDRVSIGPNATVMEDVPTGAAVLSPKSRVMKAE